MIHYAPVLPAEGWTSIDRYRADYEREMQRWFPEMPIYNALPSEALKMGKWQRRYFRDIAYLKGLNKLSKAHPQAPVHVFDHSYAHLCRAPQKSILHCRDLNHLVLPSLKGLQLVRWKQRLQGMRKADVVVAISQQLAEELVDHLSIPEDRIRVIHHGVDLECYRPDRIVEARANFSELAKLAESHFLILNVGTNLDRKNLETVYEAVRKFKIKNIPVKLIRVGSNGSREGEEARIRGYGLEDDVIQMGMQNADEVAMIMNLCNAMSFASLYEGFGRPLLEAQACGLPLVAANNSCLPEIAADGALYHDPLSSDSLVEQLSKVLAKSTEVGHVVQCGIENVLRFGWQQHMKQMVCLYKTLM